MAFTSSIDSLIVVMALAAAPAVTLLLIAVFHLVPSSRVRVDLQACPAAVAGHAGLAVAVACLAGLQVPPRLPGMVR